MWNEIKQYYLQRHPLNAPLKKSNLNNKLSKNKSLNDLFLEKTKHNNNNIQKINNILKFFILIHNYPTFLTSISSSSI